MVVGPPGVLRLPESGGERRRWKYTSVKTHPFKPTVSPISLEDLLTTEQVAADLKIAPKTVRSLCAARALSAIRVCRRWRVPAESLEAFKRQHLSARV
jgi:excisionase family DNA binding protein